MKQEIPVADDADAGAHASPCLFRTADSTNETSAPLLLRLVSDNEQYTIRHGGNVTCCSTSLNGNVLSCLLLTAASTNETFVLHILRPLSDNKSEQAVILVAKCHTLRHKYSAAMSLLTEPPPDSGLNQRDLLHLSSVTGNKQETAIILLRKCHALHHTHVHSYSAFALFSRRSRKPGENNNLGSI